jgi:hypothetical protein
VPHTQGWRKWFKTEIDAMFARLDEEAAGDQNEFE